MKATRTVRALRDFLYAADGIHTKQISKGDEVAIVEDIIDGLKAEAYVEEMKAELHTKREDAAPAQVARPLSPPAEASAEQNPPSQPNPESSTESGHPSDASGPAQPSSAAPQGPRSRRNR